ncbi:MAG: radical SAM protein [Chitinophagales bacterium]|nr:radical SAM protein [Chitinophagales bacterium]
METGKFRVALVNVPPLGIIEPWYDAPEFPRGSLACLAAYLRKHSDFEILVVDAKFDRLSFNQTIEKIVKFDPNVCGFTAFTNEIKPCAYVAAKIKLALPKTTTLVGGAHLTALPDRTLMEFPSFDAGITGDGEITLLEFCNAVKNSNDFDEIEGVIFRKSGRIIINKPRARILDLDSLPMPAWDLFRPANHYWIQAQRGCPFKCHFCMNHNGRVARKNSVERTIEEMEFLIDSFEPEWIRFGDELFTVDMQRTAELLGAIAERGIGRKVKWDVQTHVKYVSRDLFKRFKAANVTQVDMGVESGDNDILKHMGKATNLDLIANAFKMAHEEGVTTGSLLLIGQPNETKKTIKKTIDLAVKINSNIPMYGIMVPFPGTEIARMAAKEEGGYRNLSTNWDEYRKQIGGAVEFAGIKRNEIELLQFWGYLKVFIWNFRFFDLSKFIWKYRTEGFNVLKKVLMQTNRLTDLFENMPKDYEQMLASDYKASYNDMIYSKEQFDVIQSNEMKRANKLMPKLIKSQQPIKDTVL